ncbi:MAG: hypothetical protein FWC40_06390 [Proteobacteria bacterium]|nr:hypothetical protein [Pseudomonadota bacterium]
MTQKKSLDRFMPAMTPIVSQRAFTMTDTAREVLLYRQVLAYECSHPWPG